MSTSLRIVIVFLLVLGNAVFVAAEYALVTGRRSRLEERAERGGRGAKTALRLMDDPVRFISTVQVGITIFAILLGAIGEPLLSGLMQPPLSNTVAFLISFAILTYLSVVVGELVPKAVALQKAEPLAIALAIPLDWLARIAYPLVWLLEKSSERSPSASARQAGAGRDDRVHARGHPALGRRCGGRRRARTRRRRRCSTRSSTSRPRKSRRSWCRDPRSSGISVDMPPEEALRAVVDSPYTRYPVYRGSLDDVVGILHVRDLFGAMHDLGLASVELESIVRPAFVVPETKDLAALLADFRREKQHMAIVIDEYGDMEGIVTLEDLLEQIVGEIEDEFDLPDTSIERIDETHIRIDGTYTIDDFNEEFDTELEQEDYHTMAGPRLRRARTCAGGRRHRASRRAAPERARGRRLAHHEDRGRVRRGGSSAD